MRIRNRMICVCVLLLSAWATPALAEEGDALAAVQRLEVTITDESSTWGERIRAYRDAKTAIHKAEGTAKTEATAAYVAIRPQVAEALRRTTLPLGGWLMGFFCASLLWGGFAVTVTIAMRSDKQKQASSQNVR